MISEENMKELSDKQNEPQMDTLIEGKSYLVKYKGSSWSSIHEIKILRYSESKKSVLVENSFQQCLGNGLSRIISWYDVNDFFGKIEVFDES